MKNYYKIFIGISIFWILAFQTSDITTYEFDYPKKKLTSISFTSRCQFQKFSKQWQGEDYYYFGKSEDSIICSVLYYKLNKEDQKLLTKPFGDMIMSGIPFAYFSEGSNLKKYEVNKNAWGQMTDDFMFRQCDIKNFEGKEISQKHMYAYGMLSKDMFINFHLSKTDCTSDDSLKMMEILNSLTIKR